jgi:tellurite methyltransferase
MQRPITGYGKDEVGDWFATLDCGHRQHVRHQPPFVEREWITTGGGRASHLGEPLNCVRCERFEWPDDFVAYKRTPEFTAATIPKGLLKDHSTKKGVWARIVILEGRLHYRIDAFDASFELDPEHQGIVVPEVLHYIAPLGEVRFYVEFHHQAQLREHS